MTRRQMLKNVRERLRYYGKQGFIFGDFKPEELSTQKLTSLLKKTGGKFLEALPTAVEKLEKITGSKISYIEHKGKQIEEKERSQLISNLKKRLKSYSSAGYGFQDLSDLDIMQMSTKEIKRVAKLNREALIREFGTTYTMDVKSPLAKTSKQVSIKAEHMLEIEKAERLANLARIRQGMAPLKKTRFFSEAGRETYLKGLQRMAEADYFQRKNEIMADNFMSMLEFDAKFNPAAKWLMAKIKEKPKEALINGLVKGVKKGFEWNLLEVYDSDSSNFSTVFKKALELLDIKEEYEFNP